MRQQADLHPNLLTVLQFFSVLGTEINFASNGARIDSQNASAIKFDDLRQRFGECRMHHRHFARLTAEKLDQRHDQRNDLLVNYFEHILPVYRRLHAFGRGNNHLLGV